MVNLDVAGINCAWCGKEFPVTEQGSKDANVHATNCPQKEIELEKIRNEK